MTRLWIYLNKHASLRNNKKMIREIFEIGSQLEGFYSAIDMYPEESMRRQKDEETFLVNFIDNLKRKHYQKLTIGNVSPDYPSLIEFIAGDVEIPGKKNFRTLNWVCLWDTENYEKVNGIFQKVYGRDIIDFPLVR